MSQASARIGPPLDEHDLYPTHEEDSVPENPIQELLARYLKDALGAYLPGKWVTGDVCMYREPNNMQKYAAPDVLVVGAPSPDPLPPVYLKWQDPPALLVAEVGSKSTFLRDEGPKPAVYARYLEVPEYLYYHLSPGAAGAAPLPPAGGELSARPAGCPRLAAQRDAGCVVRGG